MPQDKKSQKSKRPSLGSGLAEGAAQKIETRTSKMERQLQRMMAGKSAKKGK